MPLDQTRLSRFRAQFRNPKGLVGRIAGSLMVIANGRMNRFVVEMLDVQATLDVYFVTTEDQLVESSAEPPANVRAPLKNLMKCGTRAVPPRRRNTRD
jgi:hypothetical protein